MKEKIDPSQQVQKDHHDYDSEYARGAHWDTQKESRNMIHFEKYLHPNDTILDVGCGTGRDAMYLAEKGYKVVGIDGSKKGIEIAQKRAAERSVQGLYFEVGKVESLPYPDVSFDAIYSGYVLGGDTLPQQMKEIARILKPRGIAYVAMFVQTKYARPSARDEHTPKPLIGASVDPYFETVDGSEDTYTEEDDHGPHTHHRIRLVLRRRTG